MSTIPCRDYATSTCLAQTGQCSTNRIISVSVKWSSQVREYNFRAETHKNFTNVSTTFRTRMGGNNWTINNKCWNYFIIRVCIIDIESLQNRLLKICYVPATSAHLPRLLFLLQPLRVLMKQTRQVVLAIKQSILLRCLWSAFTNFPSCTWVVYHKSTKVFLG